MREDHGGDECEEVAAHRHPTRFPCRPLCGNQATSRAVVDHGRLHVVPPGVQAMAQCNFSLEGILGILVHSKFVGVTWAI